MLMEIEYEYLTADQCEDLKRTACFKTDRQWGAYGPEGESGLSHKPLRELSTPHLENILITQPQISPEVRAIILYLLKQRYQNEVL